MKTLLFVLVLTSGVMGAFVRDDALGVVHDTQRGLMWQDDVNVSETWADAHIYCDKLELAGFTDWTLSDIDTLMTTVDPTSPTPAPSLRLAQSAFVNVASGLYWSATPVENHPGNAWVVDYVYNEARWVDQNGTNYIRCVRKKGIAPAVLLYLLD